MEGIGTAWWYYLVGWVLLLLLHRKRALIMEQILLLLESMYRKKRVLLLVGRCSTQGQETFLEYGSYNTKGPAETQAACYSSLKDIPVYTRAVSPRRASPLAEDWAVGAPPAASPRIRVHAPHVAPVLWSWRTMAAVAPSPFPGTSLQLCNAIQMSARLHSPTAAFHH